MKFSRLFLSLTLILAALILSAILEAIPLTSVTPGTSETTDNNVYGGLKWNFGEGFIPELVLGFRRAWVKSTGDTQGADVSISAKFIALPTLSTDFFDMGKLRTKYFNGVNFVQGEVSGGYDFGKGLFVGGSLNGPYSNLGVDYLFTSKSPFETYIMVDSLGRYKKPYPSCPAGFVFQSGACLAPPAPGGMCC